MTHQSARLRSNTLAIILSTGASLALLTVALIIGYCAPRPVHAASVNQPVVVELFTSEGCSSCPPADALLAQLDAAQSAGNQPVIVLSEHVTYWNHDGWHDPFSNQAFTDRQSQYSNRFGLSDVYTPQAIVDGAQELVGSDRAKLVKAIQAAAGKPKIPITLENAQWSGDSAAVDVTTPAVDHPATFFAALADDSDQSSVLHGENQGRNLRHVAVVRTLVEVHKLKSPLTRENIQVKLPAGVQPQSRMRFVVFLADNRTGQILGASMQPLNR